KLEKTLAGIFRRGSGITGSGVVAGLAAVVAGFFCGSDALIWTKPRAFGAGFGTGTVCAEDGAAIQAAMNNANATGMTSANCLAIPNGGFLFNAKILSG